MKNSNLAGFQPILISHFIKAIFFASAILTLPTMAKQTFVNSAISLKEALELTLQKNPDLIGYPLAIRQTEAIQEQAIIGPRPILGVELENSLGSGEFQNFNRSEISLTYSQVLELGNKQQNRLRFASEKTRLLHREFELTRLDVLAETSRRYYKKILLNQQLGLLVRRMALEKKALQTIQHRANAGAVGSADATKMALRLAHTKNQKQKLEAEQTKAEYRLTAMWLAEPKMAQQSEIGEKASPQIIKNIPQTFKNIPNIPKKDKIIGAVNQLPSMLFQQALQRLSDSKLQLARANGQNNLTLSFGLKQHQQTSDQSMTFGFEMPLSFENSNRGRIKAAQLAKEQSNLQTESRKQQLILTLLEIRQQLLAMKNQAESHKNNLLPLAKRLLKEIEIGYQNGQYSVFEWVNAQSELFSIERSMLSIYWQLHLQILELERVTGQSMTNNIFPSAGEE